MIEVTCAIIRNEDGEVLVVQRGAESDHPLKWEFPGGKTRNNESHEECIIREIEEELSLDIVICDSLTPVDHDYGNKQVRLIPFVCDTLLDLPVLHEHNAYRWVEPVELAAIDFTGADIPVAMEYFNKYGADQDENGYTAPVGEVDVNGIIELLSGNFSSDACKLLAESAAQNGAVLNSLIKLSLAEEPSLAFRSSWCVTKTAEIDPVSVEPYYRELVQALPSVQNESVTRSILKIVSESDISLMDETSQGIIATCCFEYLNSGLSPVALKVYSMEALYKLTLVFPELGHELRSSLMKVMEDGSAGVKARGKYIIERLRRDSYKQ
jgi:8-oxo-dGTP diphosphatase